MRSGVLIIVAALLPGCTAPVARPEATRPTRPVAVRPPVPGSAVTPPARTRPGAEPVRSGPAPSVEPEPPEPSLTEETPAPAPAPVPEPAAAAPAPGWRVAADGTVGCADPAAVQTLASLRQGGAASPRLLAQARRDGQCMTVFRRSRWSLESGQGELLRLRLEDAPGRPVSLWFLRRELEPN